MKYQMGLYVKSVLANKESLRKAMCDFTSINVKETLECSEKRKFKHKDVCTTNVYPVPQRCNEWKYKYPANIIGKK